MAQRERKGCGFCGRSSTSIALTGESLDMHIPRCRNDRRTRTEVRPVTVDFTLSDDIPLGRIPPIARLALEGSF